MQFDSQKRRTVSEMAEYPLRKIEAIIRRERLEIVKSALSKAGIKGMTVTQVQGRGQQRARMHGHGGRSVTNIGTDMLQRLKIEVFIDAENSDRAVKVIRDSAATGQVGDGKIFVLPVEEAIRIRTEEKGSDAI